MSVEKEIIISLKVSCSGNALEKAIQELKSLIGNPMVKMLLKGKGVQIVGEPDIHVKE